MEKDHKETLENKERKYNHKNYWCTAELWCDPTETHKGEQKKNKIQTQLQKQLQKMKGHKKLQTEKKTATEEQEKTTKYKNKHDNHIYTKTVKKKQQNLKWRWDYFKRNKTVAPNPQRHSSLKQISCCSSLSLNRLLLYVHTIISTWLQRHLLCGVTVTLCVCVSASRMITGDSLMI